MTQIALYEAKNRLSELVGRVEAGETIIITRRGKAVAQLSLPRTAAGRRRAADAVAALRAARAGAALGGLSARELIAEGRR
jgi:antitoxin (DNA-binding transcriptional repressor) of toxin-antitoxin stability system